eukprot:gene14318-30487_t
MNITDGFWLPHTSSVDFCEPNYHLSHYIAEPHNVWSSFALTYFAIIGYLFSNPTQEYRFSIMYVILGIVGLGSVGLHSTLHWILQSSDEVPMLWLTSVYLYGLYEMKSPHGSPRWPHLPFIAILMITIQTFIYYRMQEYYISFLIIFILSVIVLVLWSAEICFNSKLKFHSNIHKKIWISSLLAFVIVGAGVWVIDMNLCAYILPYYLALPTGGMTLHLLWHLSSGIGAYHHIAFQIVMRMDALGHKSKISWTFFNLLPLISIDRDEIQNTYPGILL